MSSFCKDGLRSQVNTSHDETSVRGIEQTQLTIQRGQAD